MSKFSVPTEDVLTECRTRVSSFLNLLPQDIRNNKDTSGKTEMYAPKRVKFAPLKTTEKVDKIAEDAEIIQSVQVAAEPTITKSREEIKAIIQAKLKEMKEKRQCKLADNPHMTKKREQTKAKQSKLSTSKVQKNQLVKKPEIQKATVPKAELKESFLFGRLEREETNNQLERKTKTRDPKQLLIKAERKKAKIVSKLNNSEDPESLKSQMDMKNAMAKARGDKLTDDTKLLVRAIKRKDKQKAKSAQEWSKRVKHVQKTKVEKQKKRTDNISKRKEQKLKKRK